jgi:transcriptional regulator
MYCPEAFRENRIETLHQAIAAAGLATLVTLHPDGLIASHVPLLLDPHPGPYGALLGHVARPNPQARDLVPDVDALAIFQPVEGYITPSYYETKRQTGKVVPTWNYAAVHAYGRITFFTEPDRLRDIVTRLTRRHEATRPAPWAVSDAPEAFIAGMLKGIIGFSIVLTRIEGKWKMSQNRPAADVTGVVAGLQQDGRPDLAEYVKLSCSAGEAGAR